MAATNRMNKAESRFNAWLSAALLFAIVIAGNQLAREHLALRRDFSEDQLYAVSPATRRILGGLEDKLLVKAYFSSDVQSGEMSIAKARLETQLEELRSLSGGRMDVVYVDPVASTEVAIEAESFGITARQISSQQGLQKVEQHVYFGALLRYRGREIALPFLDPWTFETEFGTSVHGLVRDKRAVVGWFGDEPEAPPESYFGTFRGARALLARRYDVRLITDLASGEGVPTGVDLLVVARPKSLHPRAAFEIDQFVQRGGKLCVLVDQARMNPIAGMRHEREVDLPPTGIDPLLRAWGAPPTAHHVWDDPWKTTHGALRLQRGADGAPQPVSLRVHSPLVVTVPSEGLDRSLPPTANLQEASFSWVQPIEPVPVPAGVERTTLIASSDGAYRTAVVSDIDTDQGRIDSKTTAEYASGSGRSYMLAAALSGRFPSIFEGGAPAPWDPFQPPNTPPGTTDEPVLSRASDTVVVVFGDADWIRDPVQPVPNFDLFPFFTQGNQKLFLNVVDWLCLDRELIDLRSREPRIRNLVDFVEEEKRERGLFSDTIYDTQAEYERALKLETEALSAARSRQWRHMLLPTLGSLALVLGFGLAWFLSQRGGAS